MDRLIKKERERVVSELHPAARLILDDFARHPAVTADQVSNLRAILDQSPELARQLNESARLGYLRGFAGLNDPHAGGAFHPEDKSIHLSLASLTTPKLQPYESGEAIFVLGHELQHAFNADGQAKRAREFEDSAQAIAQSDATVHDYTAVLAARLAGHRRDEAAAEIAGWNAVVSAIKKGSSEPSLRSVFRMAPSRVSDFLERSLGPGDAGRTPKSNLALNSDLTITPTRENVEAMGRNYFDKKATATRLGFHGNSDYVNYYAASAIGWIVQMEAAYASSRGGVMPHIAIDMARLGLSEKLLEENGLDLGDDSLRMPYLDLSGSPPERQHFDHTHETHEYRPATRHRNGKASSAQESPPPNDQGDLSPTQDIGAYMDRMLQAAASGDDAMFRKMTQALADLPAGRASTAQAKADVDMQELLAAQQWRQQQRNRQMEALGNEAAVMPVHR